MCLRWGCAASPVFSVPRAARRTRARDFQFGKALPANLALGLMHVYGSSVGSRSVIINLGDVADGVLVGAIGSVLHMLALPRTSRRTADELSIAGWADTDALTRDVKTQAIFGLPGLSEQGAAEIEAALQRDDVQSALQSLLAARLTDAPETYAIKARATVRLALDGIPHAEALSNYFDHRIGDLVAHLEGKVGLARLSQIRNEAYGSRIVAILDNIEFQLAALSNVDRGGPAEVRFLESYRVHVRDVHGKLEPPDFERRRKVTVDKIYVNASVHTYLRRGTDVNVDATLNVIDLAEKIDRTVLLGDPGGGKTTASNVVANYYANIPAGKIPFLVTLREYAAVDPPEHSVVGHIEHNLTTKYQCASPGGLVDRLLRTGRAVVIFDGLDELLNTYRRRDISTRVEQFCVEYPFTPVLVTSRLVGYDEARLDGSQFEVYRLGGFGEREVAEYARKWFEVQEGAVPGVAAAEAQAFLAESASASDLRSNPLLLSLMCILYRGEGSLPRDRTGIYARCAELLLRKWDEMRRIHRELRDGYLIEPAISHLAWWLFTREDPQMAVTERQLVAEITTFLLQRGFESVEQAQVSAREFAESCSGRMWVLSDIGTTPKGEKLYSFTHRTFLEYFTAVRLATVSDTPEDLALALEGPLLKGEWEVVSQLAVQIKDRNSERGADRVYSVLLDSAESKSLGPSNETASEDQGRLLSFLARSLESAEPSPGSIRRLTAAALDYLFDQGMSHSSSIPLRDLLSYAVRRDELVADELSQRLSAMITSDNDESRVCGLGLIVEIPWISRISTYSFWAQWSRQRAAAYRPQIAREAERSSWFMTTGLYARGISVETALAIAGDLGPLVEGARNSFSDIPIPPYSLHLADILVAHEFSPREETGRAASELAAIGSHVLRNLRRPLLRSGRAHFGGFLDKIRSRSARMPANLDKVANLGLLALTCMYIELEDAPRQDQSLRSLLDFPVPTQFEPVLEDWLNLRVNFVDITAR